jgi:hypothetical protein
MLSLSYSKRPVVCFNENTGLKELQKDVVLMICVQITLHMIQRDVVGRIQYGQMFSYLTYSLSCSQNSWGLFILVIY